ncbi:MAG: sigma-70 family RNA polymerase sigma factor [Clostridiaceae bacterium]|nr:sigma-70 family RNA polymerase sigma factor [Clostridiaceae bacterium]
MDYNEIESLVELAKANDKNAKEELMMKFTPLILNLSKKSFVNSYEFADIKNECYHTLFKCVSVYNLDKHRFVAYSTNAIKNSINLLIRVSIRRNTAEGPEAFILDGKLENTICSDLEDFDSLMLNKLYTNRLNAALKTLSPIENELVKYVYFQKHSLKKYSQFKGISYPLVITMKNEILYKLKRNLNSQLNNNKRN